MTTLAEFQAQQKARQKEIESIRRTPKPDRLVTIYGEATRSGSTLSVSGGGFISGTNRLFNTTSNLIDTLDTISLNGTEGLIFTAPFSRYYSLSFHLKTLGIVTDDSVTSTVSNIHNYLPFNMGNISLQVFTDSSISNVNSINQGIIDDDILLTYFTTGGASPYTLNVHSQSGGSSLAQGSIYLQTGDRVWIQHEYDLRNIRNMTGINASSSIDCGFTFTPTVYFKIEEIGVDY